MKTYTIITSIAILLLSCATGTSGRSETMAKDIFTVYYVGSSEPYTIYYNDYRKQYVLVLSTMFERVQYELGEELANKASKGNSLIDEVHLLIDDPEHLINKGKVKVVNLPDSLFKDF